SLQVVTFLVFLAGTAEARIVASDLLASRRAGRRLHALRGYGGSRGLAGDLAARLAGIGPGRHRRQFHRRVTDDLDLEEPLDHGRLHALEHVLEEIERFLLVLRQRVALAVAAQPDPFLEVVDREQMVLPLRVEDDQHLVTLERLQELGAELALPLDEPRLDRLARRLVERLTRHDLAELRRRNARIELAMERLGQPAEIPVLGVCAPRGVGVDGAIHELVDPVGDGLGLALALQDLASHPVDDLALLVHYVVVLEQMLADLEVVSLDALLRGGDGAGHELVLDRLALLHAQALHDPFDALRAEDAEQIVLEREVEARGARVTLAAGAPAELIVHAARLVALGADDVQAAALDHALVLRLGDPPGLAERGLSLGRRGRHGVEPALAHDLLRQEVW